MKRFLTFWLVFLFIFGNSGAFAQDRGALGDTSGSSVEGGGFGTSSGGGSGGSVGGAIGGGAIGSGDSSSNTDSSPAPDEASADTQAAPPPPPPPPPPFAGGTTPMSFDLVVNGAKVTLSFDQPDGNIDGSSPADAASYNIYIGTSTDPNSFFSYGPLNGSGSTTITLTPGITTYYFAVSPVNSSGFEGTHSNLLPLAVGAP